MRDAADIWVLNHVSLHDIISQMDTDIKVKAKVVETGEQEAPRMLCLWCPEFVCYCTCFMRKPTPRPTPPIFGHQSTVGSDDGEEQRKILHGKIHILQPTKYGEPVESSTNVPLDIPDDISKYSISTSGNDYCFDHECLTPRLLLATIQMFCARSTQSSGSNRAPDSAKLVEISQDLLDAAGASTDGVLETTHNCTRTSRTCESSPFVRGQDSLWPS
ncbi:hypothetical protein J1614_011751 [Plenodomus biglobosus]|nr:hypothetical protein J1614_011751 [Plenodomus biglobosus]